MNNEEKFLQIREKIQRILMNEWDPIGVRDIPEAADEYDSYLGDVYRLVVQSASASKIAEYLRYVEVEQMGMIDAKGAPLLAESVRDSVAASLKALNPK